MNKTHPVMLHYNKFRNLIGDNIQHKLHAEIMAIHRIKHLGIDWSKVELYIYRNHKDGTLVYAKPCKACENYIRDMGIKKVYYTGEGSYIYEEIA